MKISVIICTVYFSMAGTNAGAQNKKDITPPPPPPAISILVIPPPPPPPSPSHPVNEDGMDLKVLPVPAVPAVPEIPPIIDNKNTLISPVIINGNGFEISIHKIKNEEMIFASQNGKVQIIKMSTWMANKKYYEKKFGMIPQLLKPITPIEN